MKNELSVKLLCLALLSTLLFVSCAPTHAPLCKHNAIYQAVTFGDQSGYPVRIAVGQSKLDRNKRHAQAQAYIDGKWKFLRIYDSSVGVGKKDYFEPMAYYNIDDFRRVHLRINSLN
ncbi:MAG: hypothetical protein GY795_07430 [Desulfobacterales bacterium]|nr:hypothetical protein [Desulfobacterales bacterium]